MTDADVPTVESDGTISWLPEGAERLAMITLWHKAGDSEWRKSVHVPPAQVFRHGERYFIRKPKRWTDAWHTTEIDLRLHRVDVHEKETPEGKVVTVTVNDPV